MGVRHIPQHYLSNLLYYTKKNLPNGQFFKRHYELWPILVVMAYVLGSCAASCIRTTVKTDLLWTRKTKTDAQNYDMLLNPRHRKLLYFGQVYEPNEELYDVLKEMEKAEKELEDEKNGVGKAGSKRQGGSC